VSDAKRQQTAASTYGYLSLPKNLTVFSPDPGGRVRFDIIPYLVTDPKHPDRNDDEGTAVVGEPWYKRPFKLHRNVGSANDVMVCPTSVGKKCPICEYRSKRIREKAEKEETDALKPSLRNLYLVIPKGHKKFEEEIHLLDISQYNFQSLLNEELQENQEHEDFPSLDSGSTLRVRFDAKTIGNSQPFAQASRIDFEEREEQYGWDALDESPNLDEILIIPSYAEVQSKFFEIDDEEDGGGLKESDGSEEEEEEDDVFDEGEEEEEKPRRKKTVSRKRKPVEEPEEEEEEEDESPRKKSKNIECPDGFTFGVDTDQYDECADCDVWDECREEKRKNKKVRRR
jgi:hypothetical protein